jgi:hypothetical protein
VRIYARGGAATYNAGADRVEGAVGMDVVYASRIARELLEMGTAEELPART